ncbi:GNAT family N-acetyltransferase [Subtercola endophyticus]|uniref:GNAT family N-acetyltransferase n=1 Tax=Subtercola endophyticus TaxID=2895559 RepID=UPI001E5374D2|nr:GNAT family N-acetyltransferase [Subtercola endophyticus]UFS59566.1 GNAT family N-acetyltransferase [Subtercola endophyticus]
MTWPAAELLETSRFTLEPLRLQHADEMVDVLGDEALYRFTGGQAPSLEVLRGRYARQVVGHSVSRDSGWLNWIVRSKASAQAIGFVQATLSGVGEHRRAELAWVVAPAAQGAGAATESASAVRAWLNGSGIQRAGALIHPDNIASQRVAAHVGMHETSTMVDGEALWQTHLPRPSKGVSVQV